MAKSKHWQRIPPHLSLAQFTQFVLPHLIVGARGQGPKLSLHVIFNYLLRLLYMSCQWKELPIATGPDGRPEIHYTRIYRMFRYWQAQGCFERIFTGSVAALHAANLLDTDVIHGDRREKRRRQPRLQRPQEGQGRQGRRLL